MILNYRYSYFSTYLMLKLNSATWIRFGIWMAIGKIESNENMIKKVKNFIIYLNNFHSTLDSKIYSEVNNIRDEIVGELDTFLYLLTLHN